MSLRTAVPFPLLTVKLQRADRRKVKRELRRLVNVLNHIPEVEQ